MGIIGIPGLYNFLSSCLLIKGLLITVFIYSAEKIPHFLEKNR